MKWKTVVLYLAIASLPFWVHLIAMQVSFSAPFCQLSPSFNDEVFHFAQPLTFIGAGFNGGYYTVGEQTATLSFFRFYSWGPVMPVIYGSIGLVTGWNFCTPILINISALSLSIFIFLRVLRPNRWQLLWVVVILVSYPALIVYTTTYMLQFINLSLALLTAAAYIQFFSKTPDERHAYDWYFIIGIIIFAGLIRATWGFLFAPLAISLMLERPSWRSFFYACVLAFLVVVLFGLLILWGAPFPTLFSYVLDAFSSNIGEGLRLWRENILNNLSSMMRYPNVAGHVRIKFGASVLQHLQIVCLIGVGLFQLVRSWQQRVLNQTTHFALAHVVVLVGIFTAVILLYSTGRSYRVFAPMILFSTALCIAQRHYIALIMLLALSSLSHGFIDYQGAIWENWYRTNDVIRLTDANSQTLSDFDIMYDPDADSGWCNTVLLTEIVPEIILAFDAGFGFSFWSPTNPRFSLDGLPQSRYIWVKNDTPEPDWDTITFLTQLGQGRLYRNDATQCD